MEASMDHNEYPPQEKNDKEEGELEEGKGKEPAKNTPQFDPNVERIELLLKESSMLNNYFND